MKLEKELNVKQRLKIPKIKLTTLVQVSKECWLKMNLSRVNTSNAGWVGGQLDLQSYDFIRRGNYI